jgi:hypothetical protein
MVKHNGTFQRIPLSKVTWQIMIVSPVLSVIILRIRRLMGVRMLHYRHGHHE